MDRRQLSSVQEVSATGLSERISPPFVAAEGTRGEFPSRVNAAEFINHISISTFHKLLHVNPDQLESLPWASGLLWTCPAVLRGTPEMLSAL